MRKTKKPRKTLRGSFTLEASLLLPFISFIIIAFLYMLFYLHDTAVLQSLADMSSEKLLAGEYSKKYISQAAGEDSGGTVSPDESLIMMKAEMSTEKTGSYSITGLFHMLRSYHSAKSTASGEIEVALGGSAAFTGRILTAELSGTSLMLDYCDDWFKQKLKKQE